MPCRCSHHLPGRIGFKILPCELDTQGRHTCGRYCSLLFSQCDQCHCQCLSKQMPQGVCSKFQFSSPRFCHSSDPGVSILTRLVEALLRRSGATLKRQEFQFCTWKHTLGFSPSAPLSCSLACAPSVPHLTASSKDNRIDLHYRLDSEPLFQNISSLFLSCFLQGMYNSNAKMTNLGSVLHGDWGGRKSKTK